MQASPRSPDRQITSCDLVIAMIMTTTVSSSPGECKKQYLRTESADLLSW
jgi:hypothetical protein